MIRSCLGIVLFVSSLFSSVGYTAFETPALVGGVNDYAQLMDDSVATKLSQALLDIHRKGGPQLAVLTVSSLEDLPIEDASMQVVKSWKLGTESKDNGILLMISKKDRKVRIEVGQGVEGDLTDAYSRRIIDNIIVPTFRQGDYTSGVVMGVDGILQRMNPPIYLEDYLGKPHSRRRQSGDLTWVHLLIFLILVFMGSPLAGLIGLSGVGRRSRYGGGWGDGGFGGGGGWSGGGGGFSGGGSSGSW